MLLHAGRAQPVGEIDQQDRVLHHEAEQHDQADHAQDVQVEAGQAQR